MEVVKFVYVVMYVLFYIFFIFEYSWSSRYKNLKLHTLSFVYPVRVYLQNADLLWCKPRPFGLVDTLVGLAGLLWPNPTRFDQEGEIATQESRAMF